MRSCQLGVAMGLVLFCSTGVATAGIINVAMTGHIQGISNPLVLARGLKIGDEVTVYVTFDNDGTVNHQYDQLGGIIATSINPYPAGFISDALYSFSSNITQAFSGLPPSGFTPPSAFYQTAGGDSSSGYLAFHYQSEELYFHVTRGSHGFVFGFASGYPAFYTDLGVSYTFTDADGSIISSPYSSGYAAVPEPSEFLLLCVSGIVGVIGYGYHRAVEYKRGRRSPCA